MMKERVIVSMLFVVIVSLLNCSFSFSSLFFFLLLFQLAVGVCLALSFSMSPHQQISFKGSFHSTSRFLSSLLWTLACAVLDGHLSSMSTGPMQSLWFSVG